MSDTTELAPDSLWRRLRAHTVGFRDVFGIDLRSLAVFRIALGTLLLLDLILRARDLRMFYTDAGVWPRSAMLEVLSNWHFSLHAASGSTLWQALLFAIAALAAIALIFGYRTRIASIISFVLLGSLMNRNTIILQGGDQLLMVLTFWAMFLPIAARWSVDAALQSAHRENPNLNRFAPHRAQRHFSVATIAVILQVLYLYLFTAMLKNSAPWTSDFTAAFQALSLQQFVTPVGAWAATHPALLKLATMYVIFVESCGPILVLLPVFFLAFRLFGLALLASLHVGFILMLHIGLFPLIDFTALSLLIPSGLWVWLHGWQHRRTRWAARETRREAIRIHYDVDCGFCLKMCLLLREFLLPDAVRIIPAQDDVAIHEILERENSWVVSDADGQTYTHWRAMQFLFSQSRWFRPIGWIMAFPPFMALGHRVYRSVATHRDAWGQFSARWFAFRPQRLFVPWWVQLLAVVFLYAVTSFNITGLKQYRQYRPAHVKSLVNAARLDQYWGMFAPYPLVYSMYPVISGTLRNGETVNLYEYTEIAPDWKPPFYWFALHENYRWRKYMERLATQKGNQARSAFGSWQCGQWNRRGRAYDEQLTTVDITFVKHTTNLEGKPKTIKRDRVWHHWCFPEFKPEN